MTSEYGSKSTVSLSPSDSYVSLWYLQSNFKRIISVSKHYFMQRGGMKLFLAFTFDQRLACTAKFSGIRNKTEDEFPSLQPGQEVNPTGWSLQLWVLYGKPFRVKELDLIHVLSLTSEKFLFKYKEISICIIIMAHSLFLSSQIKQNSHFCLSSWAWISFWAP